MIYHGLKCYLLMTKDQKHHVHILLYFKRILKKQKISKSELKDLHPDVPSALVRQVTLTRPENAGPESVRFVQLRIHLAKRIDEIVLQQLREAVTFLAGESGHLRLPVSGHRFTGELLCFADILRKH